MLRILQNLAVNQRLVLVQVKHSSHRGANGINPMSALSLLGNKNEREQSTTREAIGENIAISLTQDPNAESMLSNLN